MKKKSTYSVDVAGAIIGTIIIDDTTDVLEVHAARHHVRADQEPNLPNTEVRYHVGSLQ